jgi:hypothetical protein
MLSHSLEYQDLQDATGARRLLVAESAIKYATHDCAAGVLYGSAASIGPAREIARRTGQLLQGSAFAFIRPAEVHAMRQRLALHSRNHAEFTLAVAGHGFAITSAHTSAARLKGPFAELVRDAGTGALAFLASGPGTNYDTISDEWVRQCRNEGSRLDIRAGFGWDHTSARAYSGTFLNQPGAPQYLRVSIGTEPVTEIQKIAANLMTAISIQ